MKKEESIYRLLSGLPGLVKKAPQNPPEEKADGDEISIFREAMKDVREIDRKKDRITPRPDKAHLPPREPTDMRRQLIEAALDRSAISVVNLPEYMEGHVEDMNPLALEKLRNGEFSIQRVLDLHGYAEADAYVLFQDFIRESVRAGLNCVKVIHGRGLKSKEAPVLKEKLKEWIVRAMHRKWVIAFSSSKMCEGGPGATCILLRRRPDKKRIVIAG